MAPRPHDALAGYEPVLRFRTPHLARVLIGACIASYKRALVELQDEGAVRPRRRRIHVKDPESLHRVADQER